MTLVELENSLPNGFHDSALNRIAIDYARRTVELEMELSVGLPDGPREQWDDYRNARITLTGLLFLVMEPPYADPEHNSLCGGELWIVDGYDTKSEPDIGSAIDSELVKKLPAEAFLYSFLVHEWNAFLHVAATDAEFSWTDNQVIKHKRQRRHLVCGDVVDLD